MILTFDRRDRERLHQMWDDIIDSNQWSTYDKPAKYTDQFETLWSQWNNAYSVSTATWSGAAMAALKYIDVKNEVVLCPSFTWIATPMSIAESGGKVVYVEINKRDLCMSYDDFVIKCKLYSPKAVFVVHIGGHIAFDIDRISQYCNDNNIALIEDCAQAHGASWGKKMPGTWGDAGIYSFGPTKTLTTGEGGMLVSKHKALTDFARGYIYYGKPNDYASTGLNWKMNEFTSAIGVLQTLRLSEIVKVKNAYVDTNLRTKHPNTVNLPTDMVSGYFKYIVFDNNISDKDRQFHDGKRIGKKTPVFNELCHNIIDGLGVVPTTEDIQDNHWCMRVEYVHE